MTYYSLRREAIELADVLTTKRKELLEAIATLNVSIAKLVEHADSLALGAADEIDAGTNTNVRKLAYQSHSPSPPEIAAAVGGKRHCGICNEPGHNARTCPQANKAHKERRKK